MALFGPFLVASVHLEGISYPIFGPLLAIFGIFCRISYPIFGPFLAKFSEVFASCAGLVGCLAAKLLFLNKQVLGFRLIPKNPKLKKLL